MPPETEQTVDTGLGEVPLAAIDIGPTSTDPTPAPGAETQQPAEGEAQPTPAQPVRIGDADYTLEQIGQIIERDSNIRAFRRSADEQHKAAKELTEKFHADPEVQKLKFLMGQIRSNPQASAEFDSASTQVDGQLDWRLQQVEGRLEVSEQARDAQAGKVAIGEFLVMQNDAAKALGLEGWTRESAEFKEFYENFEADVDVASPFGADLEAYFWKTRGPQLLATVSTAAAKQGAEQAVATIQAGRRMAKNTVPPVGHEAKVPYEPDMTDDTLEPEIQAALADTSILSDLT